MGKSAQEHYKNFHKKLNSHTRGFTLSGQKLLGISAQARNSWVRQEHFCRMGSPGSSCRKASSVDHWIT